MQPQSTIQSITYDVPSRTRRGKMHTVSVDPRDLVIIACTCEAGAYNTWCWHRDWVQDGRAGKARVRISVTSGSVQRARVSAEGRALVAALDV